MNRYIAIVDYGSGNLYSIKQALLHVGLKVVISSNKKDLEEADALILPGVGAFGDAMRELKKRRLIEFIKDYANSGRILIGICLGMQLLMKQSKEFGTHRGLNLIPGGTNKFINNKENFLKVPQIGWNHIMPYDNNIERWENTLLTGINVNEYMYFVHSYYVEPLSPDIIIAQTQYGDIRYCSALKKNNIYGFQFHPERSGTYGLKIYNNLKKILNAN